MAADLQSILERLEKAQEKTDDNIGMLFKGISRLDTNIAVLDNTVDSYRNYVAVLENNLNNKIDNKIYTHRLSCGASTLFDMEKEGIIRDVRSFSRNHPLISAGSIAGAIVAVLELVRGII